MSEDSDNSKRLRLTIVSIAFAALAWTVLIAGFVTAIKHTMANQSVASEIRKLEEELGVMHVTDPERVYFVAIDNSKVPSVVTDNVDRIWQFRCFLPAGYGESDFTGDGQVAAEGFYHSGGASMGSSSPRSEAVNKLLSISLTKKKQYIEIYSSLGNTTRFRTSDPYVNINELVIKPVVSLGDPERSFGPEEIIPLFKFYDPAKAKEKVVDGQKLTTYSGATLVMYPSSQAARFKLLREGRPVKSDQDLEETDLE